MSVWDDARGPVLWEKAEVTLGKKWRDMSGAGRQDRPTGKDRQRDRLAVGGESTEETGILSLE